MALASALRHNPQLRVLNFNDNTFTKKGTLAMAQVRPSFTHWSTWLKHQTFWCLLLLVNLAGPEAPEERAGGQLRRLPRALGRSHRPRRCAQRGTSGRQGESSSETLPPGGKLVAWKQCCLASFQDLNLSFGEITTEAALVVAQAVMDKPHMQRLDLNGRRTVEILCSGSRKLLVKGLI